MDCMVLKRDDMLIIEQMNLNHLFWDEEIFYQVQESRKDRTNGRVYDKKQGLDYLQKKSRRLKMKQVCNIYWSKNNFFM